MPLKVICVVLLAALCHATWNFLVKRSTDPYQGISAVVIGHVPFGLIGLYFAPPLPATTWYYILFGTILHLGYQFFLVNSYRFGDLSQVYPMARGGAPLITALVSIMFLHEQLKLIEIAALIIIGTGIVSLAFTGDRKQLQHRYLPALLALVTAGFIASYSLVDGLGARHAGTALGYYGFLTTINGLIFTLLVSRIRPGLVSLMLTRNLKQTLFAGGISYLAYVLVIWSFTKAPIALVASLRETSVIFALLLGVVVLKERLTPLKAGAVLLTLAGIIFLRLGAFF